MADNLRPHDSAGAEGVCAFGGSLHACKLLDACRADCRADSGMGWRSGFSVVSRGIGNDFRFGRDWLHHELDCHRNAVQALLSDNATSVCLDYMWLLATGTGSEEQGRGRRRLGRTGCDQVVTAGKDSGRPLLDGRRRPSQQECRLGDP